MGINIEDFVHATKKLFAFLGIRRFTGDLRTWSQVSMALDEEAVMPEFGGDKDCGRI